MRQLLHRPADTPSPRQCEVRARLVRRRGPLTTNQLWYHHQLRRVALLSLNVAPLQCQLMSRLAERTAAQQSPVS